MGHKRRVVKVLLFCIFLSGIFLVAPVAKASSPSAFQVGEPRLPGQASWVPSIYGPTVEVNVTSPNQLINVTLLFRALPVSSNPSNLDNLSLYNRTLMLPSGNAGDNYTFRVNLPPFANQTNVWGLVEAFDAAGNVAMSSQEPAVIYFVMDEKPYASIDFQFYVLDVNPKYLNLTTYVSASIFNSLTYGPITVNDFPSGDFYVSTSNESAPCCWSFNKFYVDDYYQGIAQLFPFDRYTYTLNFTLSPNLNFSRFTINQQNLTANEPVSNVISFSARNLGQIADDSAWTLTSSAEYVPHGPNGSAELNLVIHLTRQPEQTEYLILIPIVVLYAFLGASILLSGDGDLTNRLFVYLSIFLFTYAFITSIRSLVTEPFLQGFSMADRFGLALVPCTIILAIASIIGWMPRVRRFRPLIDLGAVGIAGYALWRVVQFQLTEYVRSSQGFILGHVTYDLSYLGWFGWLTLLALFCGAVPIAFYLLGTKGKSLRTSEGID